MQSSNLDISRSIICPEEEKLINTPKGAVKDRLYAISFEHYKKKLCEIRKIGKSGYLTKALEWFREVGLASAEDELPKADRITNGGHYAFLYKGLTDDDVEIKEYKLSNVEGRIFYYIDEAAKTINCVLIKNSHIELK